MKIEVKSPIECTSAELSVFQKLVIQGGEVNANGLMARIRNAEKLVFVNENECVAIGAIKNPEDSYKLGVFVKAGAEEKAKKHIYEVGWLYVIPAARNRGLSRKLMQVINEILGNSTCYATTRESNQSMHYLFPQYNFYQLGTPYKSNKNYSLVLYSNRP